APAVLPLPAELGPGFSGRGGPACRPAPLPGRRLTARTPRADRPLHAAQWVARGVRPVATLHCTMEETPLDTTDLERHRAALTGHCYRMLGSPEEADDAVQETFVRAWRSLDRFEQRSSLKTWLYSIATRVCLDALGERARRVR